MSHLHRTIDLRNPHSAHYERLASHAMGRPVHLWTYGWGGRPVIAFPTAGGYAHEWQHHGVVDALGDHLVRGRLRLFCPETNVSETWTSDHWDVDQRLRRHAAYERFVVDELVPRVRHDSGRSDIVLAGCSVGALYAVNFSLKFPELFGEAIGLSGRYDARFFTGGSGGDEVYYHDPLAYAWGLHGDHLRRICAHTHVTLVCGQGNFEGTCLAETTRLAQALGGRGVPLWTDLWGRDVAHEWHWWRRQIRYHVGRRVR